MLLYAFLNLHLFGPVAINHGNLYKELLALVLGNCGVFYAEVDDTE